MGSDTTFLSVSGAEEAMVTHNVCPSHDLRWQENASVTACFVGRMGEVGFFCSSKCRQKSMGRRNSATIFHVSLVEGLNI